MPVIKIYNSLTRRLEEFQPLEQGIVKIYVCGPTVYDYNHLGHGRTYVLFDALKRYLSLRGFHVFHVMNITDIDDKIIKKAQMENRDWREVVDTYLKDYMDVLEKLNIKVDLHPRVTEHISEIIDFIQILIDKEYAYVTPSGNVYFEVDKYSDYGLLSNRLEKTLWSQEQEFLSEKKKPYDFALWKAWKPGEPYWDSPWGRGRPGWHIECSVMSSKYLGKQFDIHGGGVDLLFPHHENERAQSESAFGVKPWVRYWVHVGMFMYGSDKMSKSLGNIIPLRDVFKKYSGEVVRLMYYSTHYHKPQYYSDELLEQSSKLYNRLVNTFELLKKLLRESINYYKSSESDLIVLRKLFETRIGFHKALSNDFNTAEALSYVNEYLTIVNRDLQYNPKYVLVNTAYRILIEFNQVLGVLDKYIWEKPGEEILNVNNLIKIIVDIRNELRKMKIYELADRIRDELSKEGVFLMDKGLETTWIVKKKHF